MSIWYFCGLLVYLSPFWYFVPRNIWQSWLIPVEKKRHFFRRKSSKTVVITLAPGGGAFPAERIQNGESLLCNKLESGWKVLWRRPTTGLSLFGGAKKTAHSLPRDTLLMTSSRLVNRRFPVQGCQINLAATYQNGNNFPNNHKIYQMTKNRPNDHKIDQMTMK
jgi:hypothetical protein